MEYNFTKVGMRSIYLLPLLLFFCSVGAMAQCDLTLSETHVSNVCAGVDQASITVHVSGGTAPYSFNFEEPTYDTEYTWYWLFDGEYTFPVSDANGCSAEITVMVEAPTPLELSVDVQDALCAGGYGVVNLAAAGGTAPYQYFLDLVDEVYDAAHVGAGNHFIQVYDANGCLNQAEFTVSEPQQLFGGVLATSEVSCPGGSDGTVTLNAFGGTAPYLFSSSPSNVIEGLFAGYQYFQITDANGCETFTDALITEREPLAASVVSTTDVSCYGYADGSVTLEATGGTAPYEYQYSSLNVLDWLAPGDYSFLVTDSKGCQTTVAAIVLEPEPVSVETVSWVDVSCAGRADGSVTLQASGGTAPYLYNSLPNETTENLAYGSYIFVITDAHGCGVATDHFVDQVMEMYLDTYSIDATCAGGNWDGMLGVTIMEGTGTPEYTYEWSPGGWTRPYLDNVPEGTYTITVTDARGCQATASTTVGSEICDELALVPTAITPNGDGANDTFRVLASDVSNVQLNVYDMFGTPVFSTTDVKTATETGWDGRIQGKDAPSGWYIWTLKGTYGNGRSITAGGGQRGRLVLDR